VDRARQGARSRPGSSICYRVSVSNVEYSIQESIIKRSLSVSGLAWQSMSDQFDTSRTFHWIWVILSARSFPAAERLLTQIKFDIRMSGDTELGHATCLRTVVQRARDNKFITTLL